MQGGIKNRDYRAIFRSILEIIQNRTIVAMGSE